MMNSVMKPTIEDLREKGGGVQWEVLVQAQPLGEGKKVEVKVEGTGE